MMAASKMGEKVEEMDAITSRLIQTNLTEDDPHPAADPTAGAAGMEVIANRLSQAALEKDGVDRGSEEVRRTQEAEAVAKAAVVKLKKAAYRQKKADQQASAALSAACDKWSIADDEGAKVKREAQQTQERLQQEHADRMQALEDAEASRQADVKHTALMKRLMETRAQARLDKKNREAKEAKGKEAAQQKQAEVDALAVQLAERRATLEREWREQALANRAKQEADNKRRQEMSKAYHNIIAHNAVLAEANAREQKWRQQQAEYLACYQAAVFGQTQNPELVQQQHHHHHHPQHEQQQQQQQPSSFGSVVSEMEANLVGNVGKGTEAIGETDMDWEPVEKGSPLPAPTLVPSVPPTGPGDASLASEAGVQPPAIATPPLGSRPDPSAGRKKANTLTAVSLKKKKIAKGARRKDRARKKATRTSSPPSSREAVAVVPTATPAPPPPLSPPPPEVPQAILPRTPIKAVIRPTVYPWSPLGRLLSQGQSIPQVVQAQVLGKREREDMDEAEPKKKAKLEGEFQSQVGKKRKWKDEEEFLLESKRARLDLAPALTLVPPIFPTSRAVCPPTAPPPAQPVTTAIPLPAKRSGSLAETIAFVNDLPTLRAEIAWMRAYRTLVDNTGMATRGKKTHIVNPIIKRALPRAAPGYWEKYRES